MSKHFVRHKSITFVKLHNQRYNYNLSTHKSMQSTLAAIINAAKTCMISPAIR